MILTTGMYSLIFEHTLEQILSVYSTRETGRNRDKFRALSELHEISDLGVSDKNGRFR